MTDALTVLGVEDKAGKDQPFSLSPKRKLGNRRMAPELVHFICSLSLFLFPRLLFPLYLQEVIHYRGEIYLLHRRLSFTLRALLCNKCGSPPSPVNYSLLAWGHSSGICTPGELLLTGLCTRMLGCWLLLGKQISKQIEQQTFALETSAEIAKALLCAWGKKSTWLWAKESNKANTARKIAIQVRKS